jgi:hypothetical protein
MENVQSTTAETVQLSITPTSHSTITATNESKIAGFSMKGEHVEPIAVSLADVEVAKASTEAAQGGQVYEQVSYLKQDKKHRFEEKFCKN